MEYLASTKLLITMRTLYILIFIFWSSTSYTQSTKDSLAELQSLLDSIPDTSLAELGIDTTAEIIPDTLHLIIPASIASDTAYARTCLNQAIELIKTGKYDDAYAKADTAKHIYQMNIGYVSKEVADCLHQLGRVKGIKNLFDDSKEIFKKSILIKLKTHYLNHVDIGQSFHNLGLIYDSKGEYDKAIEFYQKALDIRIKTFGSDNAKVCDTYNNLGVSHESKGEYDKAIEYHQKALDIRKKILGPDHPNVGNSYLNLGVCYHFKGEYDKAVDYFQKALDIHIKSFGPNHQDVGSSYNNFGISYISKGEYYKAIDYFQKALDIQLKTLGPDHPVGVTTYNNLGVIYESKAEYKKAIDYFQKALNVQIKILGPDHPDGATTYNNLGVSYKSKREYDKAIHYFQKALDIRIKTIGHDHPDIGQSFHNLGLIYEFKGEYDKAIEFYQKAIDVQIKTFGPDHPVGVTTYNNLGVIYESKGEYDKAIEFKQKALDIRLETLGPNHPDVGQSFNNLGVSYESKGEYDKAIDYFQKSLDIRLKSLGLIHPDVLSSQNNLAKAHKNLNELDFSLYYLYQAISGIKAQMASDISAETKNLYQSQNIPVFESAIEVSLIKSKQDQHDSLKRKTYEYTELAKASLLQSQIKQTDALAFAGIPDSLLQKEYDLRIDINWREKQRQGLLEKGKTETDTTVLRISSIIFDLKRAQETLFETLEKDYPEYYRLKYDTRTISLENTQQKLLQKDQTMLEYFVGDSSIFIFVVRPDTFEVVQIKKDFSLDSLVRQMQSGLYGYYSLAKEQRKDEIFKKSLADFSEASHNIYQRIIAPVQHLLTTDMVIIPDGVLGYVPFEALLKSKPEKLNQFGSYPYMINDHTISYNYSATLWNEMKSKKHKKEPFKSLVAFAPFYEGSYTVLDSTINLVFDTLADGRDTTIFQDVVSRKTYAPLPSSGIEAGTVSKMWKGDYYINDDATEQKFYDVAGEYRFVHLSTHGVADARQGDYSYLAFAEQKDSIENEFLYVRDIYNTQLNADLVFLSACETAQGELQRGEGIISLARAFAYAGAKSIITTLWQVDDEATKDISIDFYKNLKKGFTKDVALRQAKLRYIKSAKSTQKHPFFWAAMIGIGDMGVVRN